MTTYAHAEAALQRAIEALRAAGLTAEADKLAALPPVVDRETAGDAACAADDIAGAVAKASWAAADDSDWDAYRRAANAACAVAYAVWAAIGAVRDAASDAASADGASADGAA